MSKQSEAKEQQGYNPRESQRVCGTCQHFQCDRDWPKWMKERTHPCYLKERNKIEMNPRCGIGGFAVKKLALCNEWKPKAA